MIECKLCGREFKNINGLAKHLSGSHAEISKEEYYQKFINEEHKTCICGNLKKFRDLGVGYLKHCSQECLKADPIFRQKQSRLKTGLKQSKHTIEKRQATLEAKYGVNNGFLTNHSKIFTYKGFTTRSSYERTFLDFAECYNYTIVVPSKIQYTFDGKTRWYYPDFYIKELDTIIEIKSKWTLKLHEDMTNAKIKYTIEAGYGIILVNETHGLLNDWEKLNEYILSCARS